MNEEFHNEETYFNPYLLNDDIVNNEEIDSNKLINIIPGAIIGSVIFVVIIRLYELIKEIYDDVFIHKENDVNLKYNIYLFIFILALSILIILFIIWMYI